MSPGSLVRGAYVVYLVIRERNIKDYNIAIFLSFFKYVGYLAFPIQMTSRYPQLARFMAAHWATEAVHMVPVFGERGALFEHTVFSLCYNYPLTVRRRVRERAARRACMAPRMWHAPVIGVVAGALLCAAEFAWWQWRNVVPSPMTLWPLMLGVPLVVGSIVTRWAGGATLVKRVATALVGGLAMAGTFCIGHTLLHGIAPAPEESLVRTFATCALWSGFLHALFAVLGTLATEVFQPERK
jgi:hypothetical protein